MWVGASLNIGILAIFYTAFGGLMSYVLHYLFDDYDDEWKNSSLLYQVYDVCVELVVIGLIAFWTMYFMREAPPIFPVSKGMDELVDTYTSGLFFAFAMFLFLGDMTSKVQHIYHVIVKPHCQRLLPGEGRLLDGTLHYKRI